MTDELLKLTREVEKLKKQKQKKLSLATTRSERDILLREINELDAVKKSPSALKSFGRNYLKGLKMTGTALWRGIRKASSNLNANTPEFRQVGKRMAKRPAMKPYSPMAEMYYPQTPQPIPKRIKKKTSKKKKGKKTMKRMNYPKQQPKSNMWNLP